jgi:hypothetical protein
MKFVNFKNTLAILCAAIAMSATARAVVNELVGSSESRSIEKFGSSGA